MRQYTKKVVGNTLWLLIGSIFRLVLHFIINIIISRYLGPTKMGAVNYIASYTAFFTSLCSLGLNGVIIHELVNHEEDGKILGTAVTMRLVLGVFSLFSMVVLVRVLDGNDKNLVLMAVLQAIQLPFLAFDSVKYWYQRNLQSKWDVLITVIAYIISAVLKIVLIINNCNYVWFALGTTADVCFLGGLYFISYRKLGKDYLQFDQVIAKRMLKTCGPFLIANITAFVYSRIDTIMIKQITSSTELVGFYSTAIAICGYIGFVPTAVLDSSRPVIMEAKQKNEKEYNIQIRKLITLIMWPTFAYSVGVSIFGKWIIQILYGSAYLGALDSLRIAVWFDAFSYLGGIKSIWLLCEGRNRFVMIFSLMGAVTNVLLNAAMIPVWGIEGAAVATLITQVISNVLYPCLFKETREFVYCSLDGLIFRPFWPKL